MTQTDIPTTPLQPIERFPGMSERRTLPGSGIEVVIRKVAVGILSMDNLADMADTRELLEMSANYAKQVGEKVREDEAPSMFKLEAMSRGMLELVRRQRAAVMREAIVAPTLDELREIYGGRPDSADLGMGPDFAFLEQVANAFNTPPKGKAGGADSKEEAQDFPGALGGAAPSTR